MLNLTRCCGLLFASSLVVVLPTVSQWVRNDFNHTHMSEWIGLLSQQMSGVFLFHLMVCLKSEFPSDIQKMHPSHPVQGILMTFGFEVRKLPSWVLGVIDLLILNPHLWGFPKFLGFYPKKLPYKLPASSKGLRSSPGTVTMEDEAWRIQKHKDFRGGGKKSCVKNALQMWGA